MLRKLIASKQFTPARYYHRGEIVNWIQKALNDLVDKECPRCSYPTGTEDYLDESDIEKWVEAQEDAKLFKEAR